MKKIIIYLLALLAIASPTWATSDQHIHKKVTSPNGGKILELKDGHVEFWVKPDRTVQVVFLNEKMQPTAPKTQVVKVTAEAKSGKKSFDLKKTETAFLSEAPLPEGDGYRIVIQIRSSPDAKPENIRLDYNATICSGCKLAEYACSCDHGH